MQRAVKVQKVLVAEVKAVKVVTVVLVLKDRKGQPVVEVLL